MTDFVDYDLQLDDMVALLKAHTTGFVEIKKDMDPRDIVAGNLPCCDVRFVGCTPQVTAGNQYYVGTTLELEIAAFNLNSKNAASTIVRNQLNIVHRALQQNPRFGDSWDALILGDVVSTVFADKDLGFLAAAVARVTIYRYANS